MPIRQLNHFFVRANDLEKTKQFYVDVLGFEILPRPDFAFPGFWLGCAGEACIHMGAHDAPDAERHYLSDPGKCATDNGGVVDHVAFSATDPAAFKGRLKAFGVEYRCRTIPDFDLYQIFVKDPNGLVIELNFAGAQDPDV